MYTLSIFVYTPPISAQSRDVACLKQKSNSPKFDQHSFNPTLVHTFKKMSKIYSAGQYESGFQPRRLGNWQVADEGKRAATGALPGGTLKARPRGARTTPIVDARGHLLPNVPKVSNAFVGVAPGTAGDGAAPPRWPAPNNPTLPAAGAATMGYKGIPTPFLPAATVTLKTVEGVPGCSERKFT